MRTPVFGAGGPIPLRAQVFLGSALLLLVLGLGILFSASAHRADLETGDPFRYLRHQCLGVGLGIVALAVAARLHPRLLLGSALPALAITLALLAATCVSGWGVERNHAQRWLAVGPLVFQPSELAKIALPLFIAYSTTLVAAARAKGGGRLVALRASQVGAVAACAALIAIQPDYGTAIFLVSVSGILLLVSGMPLGYGVISGILAAPGLWWLFERRSEELNERLQGLLNPESVYQVKRSLFGIGSGGITGKGFGLGMEAIHLPEEFTDFIFSVWGEETGFLGVLLLLGLFAVLLESGWRIVRKCPHSALRLLAAGIVINIVLQALINVAVATGSAPTKGIALPFVSYGSSGLTVVLLEVGMLLSIARFGRGRSSG